ncbi:MAG: Copper binding protein plastocyanin/azurin family [Acidimicrobiaceae bacterium]|nr:Copper binding protein plastocyanin/azurin family [Acidimicrobiaceae bacterium]
MRRRILSLAAAAVLVGFTGGGFGAPAHAAELQFVTGPGSQITNYTVPALVIHAGDTVTYTNVDVAPHDVVSTRIGPDRPWCASAGFTPGTCPLVWTPLQGLAGSSKIYGLESLKPGDQVPFHCTVHPGMQATLVVLPV